MPAVWNYLSWLLLKHYPRYYFPAKKRYLINLSSLLTFTKPFSFIENNKNPFTNETSINLHPSVRCQFLFVWGGGKKALIGTECVKWSFYNASPLFPRPLDVNSPSSKIIKTIYYRNAWIHFFGVHYTFIAIWVLYSLIYLASFSPTVLCFSGK